MPELNPTIEQEIADLEKQLQEKKSALGQSTQEESGKEVLPDKEALRQVVGEKLQQQIPQYQPQVQPSPKPQTLPADGSHLSYLMPELKDKVQELINLVFNKSLDEGIKEAAKVNNSALIDAFHDVLTDELYGVLVERGKIKEVK